MPDWKNIGLTGKDVLMGVVTVVAGAQGGQAGAQGAQQLDRGLNRVLDMAGVKDSAPSRMNPEEADFAVRKQALVPANTAALRPAATPSTPSEPQPTFLEAVVDEKEKSLAALPPLVKEDLVKRGYTDEEIQDIASGQYRGIAKRSMTGARVATKDGVPHKSAAVDSGGAFEGFSLGDVMGVVKSLGKG